MRIPILSYTIQQVIPNVCTKFQNPRCSASNKSFMKKKRLHIGRQTDKYTDKHCYGQDKNYIPLYTSYAGCIKI